MDLDGESGFNGGKEIFEIFYPEIGMHAALHEYLRAALGNRLFDLFEYFFLGQDIGLGAVRIAVEGAEGAFIHADIGVIDIAVHDEGHEPLGVEPLPHAVREFPEGEEVGLSEQGQGLRRHQCVWPLIPW